MNLRQLRYISAVARHGLNVSATAESLYTSQPGVSRQIRQLEDELGVQIFERSGRLLTRVTPAGQAIIERAERALIEIETIRSAAQEHRDPARGELRIAASHTQARHALPAVLGPFAERYPEVRIDLHQGTPMQIAELVSSGSVDFGIATEALEHFEELALLPCYRWSRVVVVPRGHPLAEHQPLTLEALAAHPICTYVFGFSRDSVLERAFRAGGIEPRVRLTATDADIVKTYVRAGLGVGIIARMAIDAALDSDLLALEAGHLFEPSTTKIALRRGTFLRGFMYSFLELFAPHLNREAVDTALGLGGRARLEALFVDAELPLR